ncbi:MAG: hypothetical protein ABS95_02020 [Verrucomicrobia bacterium SCN 57-15]|nr:MAG: hypothetical protein ABS95_02020 [Verrucomicrobia bacterium SCN 57-15]
MSQQKPNAAAAAPSLAPQAVNADQNAEVLLARYKVVGEDHPSFRKLKEALARKQEALVKAAVAELEEVRRANVNRATTHVESKPRRYWLWIFLWGTFLAVCLYILSHRFIASHVQDIIARNTHPVEIIASETLGGKKSEEITARILKEVDDLKPDRCFFIGHQLAKKEIVEYLSALSQIASVRLILGTDSNGHCQLADPKSPLRQYGFTEVRQSSMPIRSQLLFAFNNRTKKAVAFVGTYPYDMRDAAQGEHALIVIHGFDECSRLYSAYAPLLENARAYGR